MADWRERAACLGKPTGMFFPERGFNPGLADVIELCGWCPVRAQCLADAMAEERGVASGYRHGVRGGLTAHQRYELDRQRVAA